MSQTFGPTSRDEDFAEAFYLIDHDTGRAFADLDDYAWTLRLADADGNVKATLSLTLGSFTSSTSTGDLTISNAGEGWVRWRIDQTVMNGLCAGLHRLQLLAENSGGSKVQIFNLPVIVSEGFSA